MTSPGSSIRVFDRSQVRRQRARRADKNHAFLHEWALDQIVDRLSLIKRKFPCALLQSALGDRDSAVRAAAGAENLIVMDHAPRLLAGRGLALAADEEYMPFAPGVFDLVLSALTLQGVNDLPGALIQIRRALRPDGAFLGAMIGGDSLCELRGCLMDAELALRGGVSPRVHPFADKRDVGALMQRAGFALPVVDSEKLTVTYKDMGSLMRELRGMGEGNAVIARSRAFLRRDVLDAAARLYAERHSDADGRLMATFEIIFMIGWAPHASQPQPLKRGSATHNLADALS